MPHLKHNNLGHLIRRVDGHLKMYGCCTCPGSCENCPSTITLVISNCVSMPDCVCGTFTLNRLGDACKWFSGPGPIAMGWVLSCSSAHPEYGWGFNYIVYDSCTLVQGQLIAASVLNAAPLSCCPPLPFSGTRSYSVVSFDWAFS